MRTPKHSLFFALALLSMTSCQSVYYGTMEKFGIEKRDILVSRVDDAKESQEEAKEQFQSALDHFTSIVQVNGGELESRYRSLQSEFELSEKRANSVRERIDAVEKVSLDLFAEWESELELYSNPSLAAKSRQQMFLTRKAYNTLIAAMKKAESKMEPVINAFRDQVLYLKHNLNAKAIASLKEEAAVVESEIQALIQEMEASIDEADSFIQSMGIGG
ncbi:MAG TPA: DUF2959 domain-containing protein [Verrucomicrobiales bacterium]|nr:DUF2959 domain-containing protein [Verrucomicrobiales bacterium]HIL69028.1 DUF2959 domain-containing protein [Verrucomicrobiota bacterium]